MSDIYASGAGAGAGGTAISRSGSGKKRGRVAGAISRADTARFSERSTRAAATRKRNREARNNPNQGTLF